MIYETEDYTVEITDNALGEDGKYGRDGYAVVNKTTKITEHTTTVLPQALFQADAFQGALGQLSDAQDDAGTIIEASPTDVLPN